MVARVWLAQLWAENSLGVLARSRTLYEELCLLVERGEMALALPLMAAAYRQPVKNHVDAYLRLWSYLRGAVSSEEAGEFLRMLQRRDPLLDLHLYRLVLRHARWYLYNSRLLLANPCPDRLWAVHRGAPISIVLTREGPEIRPWAALEPRLAEESEASGLARAAEAELVLLRVDGELFWNPKLEGLPGGEALGQRLRRGGVAFHRGREAREAAG